MNATISLFLAVRSAGKDIIMAQEKGIESLIVT